MNYFDKNSITSLVHLMSRKVLTTFQHHTLLYFWYKNTLRF